MYANIGFIDTAAFVNETFEVVHTKSYKAGYIAPRKLLPEVVPQPLLSGPAGAYAPRNPSRGPGGILEGSKKRSHNDVHGNGVVGDSHYARGDRQMKQMRRGGRGNRGDGFSVRGNRSSFQESRDPFPHAGSPPLQPGFSNAPNITSPQGLPFDPNDPMSAILAIQAMGLPPLPGMQPPPYSTSPNGNLQAGGNGLNIPGLKRERCRDYDMQGYCARGDTCPFEHGTDRLIAPGQDGMSSRE